MKRTIFILLLLTGCVPLWRANAQTVTQEQCQQADAQLNQVYQQLRGSLNDDQKQELKQAQRDWIKKRDAFVTANPANLQGALYQVTIQRIAELRSFMRASDHQQQQTPLLTNKTTMYDGVRTVRIKIEEGKNYINSGKLTDALKVLQSALILYERSQLSESHEKGLLFLELGVLNNIIGEYEKSISFFNKAILTFEGIHEYQSIDMGIVLLSLGQAYRKNGEYIKAMNCIQRGTTMVEKNSGLSDINTLIGYDEIANCYDDMGNFTKAFPLHQKVIGVAQKRFGNLSLEAAGFIASMGFSYLYIGDYKKALEVHEKALFIRTTALGINNPHTARSLDYVAQCYLLIGDYEKAEELFLKSLCVREKVLGSENLITAESLYNLAVCYSSRGQDLKALPLYERALSIRKNELSNRHPDFAKNLDGLASCYVKTGEPEKARQSYEQSLTIRKNVLGERHPDTATSLNHLAGFFSSEGNLKKSLLFEQQALSIRESVLGSNHPDTAESLHDIACVNLKCGNASEASAMASRWVLSITEQLKNMLSTGEKQRLSWSSKNLSFAFPSICLDAEMINSLVLQWKGIVLDSLLEDLISLRRFGSYSPEILEIQSARTRISKIAFSNAKQDQSEIEQLKARIDAIISSAADQRVKMGRVRESAMITPYKVASALSEGWGLIDFIQFTDSKIKGDAGRCYGALILGRDGKSKFVRIEDAAGIDALVHSLREAIAKGDEKSLEDQQKILSEKLWTPVARNLTEGTKKLFIGPDGQLNFLSFAALPTPDGSFLAEHYDIAYVGSGRDLARKVTPSDSKSIALFADPIFDLEASVFSTNALALRSGEADAFGKIVLPPLPGTRTEESIVEEVSKSAGWTPEAHLGKMANKSAIMALKSPGILHLATHGFYLNNLPSNGAEGERGMKLMELGDSSKPALPPKIDPMHASGIALTGAQATLKAWSEGRVPDPNEDGILTAEEVGALNLDGTWLVTLSACETGVGAARSGEGVFGLRRAFMIAGAQNLLMTLWPVSDEVTPKIMADFYKEALASNDAAGSLAKVQRDWLVKLRKEKGLLAAVRDAGPFAMVVMAKQDSTFSSPSIATPIASPQTTAGPLSPSVPVPTPAPPEPAQPVPSSSPAPSLTPGPEASPSATPGTSPNQTPSPEASPSETPVLSELVEFKKAA
jgi:tetratricopeptide (TPR) repeat protein/CHAT domain-containing protein